MKYEKSQVSLLATSSSGLLIERAYPSHIGRVLSVRDDFMNAMRLRNPDTLLCRVKKEDSHKLRCSQCTRVISIKDTKRILKKNSKKFEYKGLCKSAKCSIHSCQDALDKIPKARTIELDFLKKITSRGLCRVREFEEHKDHQTEINPATLLSVESLMENIKVEDIKFEKYLGQGFVKDAITRLVIWPINKPKVFKGLRTAPKGILLFGPAGVGKTTIGKYIAYQTHSSFFNLSASAFACEPLYNIDSFVKALFLLAKARQPSVIFIDELDILLSRKAIAENEYNRKIKKEFLSRMDMVDRNPDDRILIIGTTRKPFDLDEDIILRFSKKFYISLPDKEARKKLLENLLESECHSLEYFDIEKIACKTEGYTVGEIKQISQMAAMGPISAVREKDFYKLELVAIKPISFDDFLCALRMVKSSLSREELLPYENWDVENGFGNQNARKLRAWSLFEIRNQEEPTSYIT